MLLATGEWAEAYKICSVQHEYVPLEPSLSPRGSGGSVATTTSSRAYSFTASLAGYWGISFSPDWAIDVNPISVLGACVPVFIAVMLLAQILPGERQKNDRSSQALELLSCFPILNGHVMIIQEVL